MMDNVVQMFSAERMREREKEISLAACQENLDHSTVIIQRGTGATLSSDGRLTLRRSDAPPADSNGAPIIEFPITEQMHWNVTMNAIQQCLRDSERHHARAAEGLAELERLTERAERRIRKGSTQ